MDDEVHDAAWFKKTLTEYEAFAIQQRQALTELRLSLDAVERAVGPTRAYIAKLKEKLLVLERDGPPPPAPAFVRTWDKWVPIDTDR